MTTILPIEEQCEVARLRFHVLFYSKAHSISFSTALAPVCEPRPILTPRRNQQNIRIETEVHPNRKEKGAFLPRGQSERPRIETVCRLLELHRPIKETAHEGPDLHSPQARHERQRRVNKRGLRSYLEDLRVKKKKQDTGQR